MITFFYGSGSPFAWKVWLTLEHKQLPYELRSLSFDRGELRGAEYAAINPRGKVPAIRDGTLSLFESNAIVEYLEEAYPADPIWPSDVAARAIARRIAAEAELYLGGAVERLLRATIFRREGDPDPDAVTSAHAALAPELAWAERTCASGFVTGAPSGADYTIYPWLAMLGRVTLRQPEHAVPRSATVDAYMSAVERLPYFERTRPPHWKA